MSIKFICNQCGLCCRNINLVNQLKEFHNGDGVCKYLDLETNLCKIYDNRPDICNVEKSYKLFFSSIYSEEEYIKMNYEGCEVLWKKMMMKNQEKK